MPRALLTIEADASSFRSALQEARGVARRATQTLNADARRGAAERARIEAEEIAQTRRDLRSMTQARQRAARERARIEDAAAKAAARAATDTAKAAQRAEARRSADAKRESKARSVLAAKEAKDIAKAEEDKRLATERSERRRTALAEQEAKKRARNELRIARESARAEERAAREAAGAARRAEGAGRARGRRIGSVLSQVGGAARSYASEVHGEMQSARARRAGTERTLGTALYQAGANRGDVQRSMRTVTEFAAANGIDSGELAEAANAAQTEFSVFGDRTTDATTRQRRMASFLDTSLLARNTGNDIGEFGRLEGLFQQQGFDDTTRRNLLLYTAGAAQRGAVETGTITRQAMPAITARLGMAMASARRNGTDPQAAAVQEYRQALAELEVARGTEGATPRSAGNAITQITNRLQGHVTQDKLLDNIRNSLGRNSALESQLYEADPTRRGRQRLREHYTNALNLVDAFGQNHLDATQFQNITGGGGHGNPMSMLQNERRVLGNLLNVDAEGKSGAARIHELMRPETALTNADVARGADLFGNDAQAALNRNQEQHDNELVNNTGALKTLSDRFADWSARNPLLAPALGAAAGPAMNGLARGAGNLLGNAGAGAGLGGAGAGAGLGVLLPAAALMTAGAMTAGAIGAGEAWTAREQAIDANRRQQGALFGGDQSVEGLPRLSLDDASIDRLAGALRAAPITAAVSAHDAAHATSAAAGSRSVPSP